MTKKISNKKSGKPDHPPGLSLFAIDNELGTIRALVEQSDGETTEAMDAHYVHMLELGKKKCDGYIASIIYVEGQAKLAKAIVAECEKRVKRWQNIADNLRDRLAVFMLNQGIEKLRPENPAMPVAYLNKGKQKLDIKDDQLPDIYIDVTEVRKPDRDKIEEAIKRGEDVAGVTKITGAPFVIIR